jgi:CubicO group peptidase (beta-lactamase class C family)
MKHTKTLLNAAEQKSLVQDYNAHNEPQPYVNYTGGPSMNSTLRDMLQYVAAQIAQKDPAIKLTHELTWGDRNGFALGLNWMMNTNARGERYIFHDGHTGSGFNTHCIFYPRQKKGFVVIVNDVIDQSRVAQVEEAIKEELDKREPDVHK